MAAEISLQFIVYISLSLVQVAAVPSTSNPPEISPPTDIAKAPAPASSAGQGGKPRTLIRRKSDLPADFDTAMALKHYNTVDKVLQSSKES